MKKILKNLFAVVFAFLLIAAIFAALNPDSFTSKQEVPFSQLAIDIEQGKVEKLTIKGAEITVKYKSVEETSISRKEIGISITESLLNYGISQNAIRSLNITIKQETGGALSWLLPVLMIALPIFIFGAFFFMIMRQNKGGGPGGGGPFGFLKSPAKVFGDGKKQQKTEKITFKDIADLEEAKSEIKEVVDFLKSPKKYLAMGARIPRGVLLVGPPGVGKTMLARAVSFEAKVPFFSIVGSEFVELFVGVGASRVKNLFQEAKKHQPSIIFIDELDAIGKTRMPGIGGGHEEREQTLNQILAEMDGFERETNLILLAATNRPEVLDPALLRAGRFDRRIVLDLPDIKGRDAILKIHCKTKPLAVDVRLKEIAERTPGFSGADLANLTNEAAISAARQNKTKVYQEDMLEAIEKVLLGPERKSHLLSKKEKEISAYHEAGHALVSASLSEAEEVRKISIVARGMVAGYTLALPKREKRIKTKSEFLADLAVLLGGYTAERIVFKEISTGSSNDLEKVNAVARALVLKYGMSKLGPITFGKKETMPFLGIEQETERNYSEKMAGIIDKEIERFIKGGEAEAVRIITKRRAVLEKIAQTLITKETIEKEEFDQIVSGKDKPAFAKTPENKIT